MSLTRTALQNRLDHATFEMVCALPAGRTSVHFPRSWPGDALMMFPHTLEQLPAEHSEVACSFTAVHRETRGAIGQLGTVGSPDPGGAQEIGYGFNPEACGQGFATEAVVVLTTHLLTWASITTVMAQTATSNPASARVLEKAGFHRTGTGWNNDDGNLMSWQFQPAR